MLVGAQAGVLLQVSQPCVRVHGMGLSERCPSPLSLAHAQPACLQSWNLLTQVVCCGALPRRRLQVCARASPTSRHVPPCCVTR